MPSFDLFNPLRYWTDDPLLAPEVTSKNAGLDKEDSLSDRYAFSLGEELGILRFTPSKPLQHAEMERGYVFGLSEPARRASTMRRKLLQVRRNAFDRGIPVSSALNEEYLQRITVAVCPVSGVELTQGTHSESDWSLDRLDNELGYVPGNVCFIAARVNKCKDSVNFVSLRAEAISMLLRDGADSFASDVGNGLMVVEALRTTALMAAPSGFACNLIPSFVPFAMAPGVLSTIEAGVAGLHVACARERIEGRAHRRRSDVFRHLGTETWRNSNRLVAFIRRGFSSGQHPCDLWLHGHAVEKLTDLSSVLLEEPSETTDSNFSEFLDVKDGFRRYRRKRN